MLGEIQNHCKERARRCERSPDDIKVNYQWKHATVSSKNLGKLSSLTLQIFLTLGGLI